MKTFLTLLALAFVTPTLAQAQGASFPDIPFQLYEYQKLDLSPTAAEKFALLEKDGFYSAFAMAPNGTYGFSTGNNTLAVAERDALVICDSFLTDPKMICALVAVTVPRGHVRSNPVFLGYKNRGSFRDYQGLRGAKAFAANDGRFVGWAYGYGSVAEAEARAVKECEAIRKQKSSANTSDVPCRVIDSTQF